MKKSEMIKILEEAINDNYDFCSLEGISISYEAVLDRLVAEGMSIPINRVIGGGVYSKCFREWDEE